MKAILCFGASITFGRGDQVNGGWTGRLKKYWEANDYYNAVYNLGIPGNTTADLLERFETECKARAVKKRDDDKFVILFGIGTNDTKYIDNTDNAQTLPKEFEENINKLINIAKKYSDKIGVIGLIPVNESKTNPYENTYFFNKRIKEFNSIMKKCCKNGSIYFIDLFSKWESMKYNNLLGDGLHPNAKGYDLMFGQIKEFLVEI